MRIGTWNVEYGIGLRNPDRINLLAAKAADIWVLTETHSDLDLSKTHVAVRSEQRPKLGNNKVDGGSTWVTIWSRFPTIRRIDVPDARRMVAAIFDTPLGVLSVAGIVLPWHDDISDDPTDPRPKQWEEHRRVLHDEMPALLRELREATGVGRRVIAGDFNSHQAFPYPLSHPYPPNECLRCELARLLLKDSFTCRTADERYPTPLPPRLVDQTLIDHVCTDFGHSELVESWSGIDGRSPRLSDHPGVIITLKTTLETKDKAKTVESVCDALLKGDRSKASATAQADYPFAPRSNSGRKYNKKLMTSIFIRDGFIDRYSGQRLIFPGALRLLSRVMPEEFPAHPNWKMSASHFVYWELFPTIDHVDPVSRGGADDKNNWVTTSMLRNSVKSHWTLDELGWTLLEPPRNGTWDGLTGWFIRYLELNREHLDDPYVRDWHKALLGALDDQ